jgi:hypothetical protein
MGVKYPFRRWEGPLSSALLPRRRARYGLPERLIVPDFYSQPLMAAAIGGKHSNFLRWAHALLSQLWLLSMAPSWQLGMMVSKEWL